MKEAQNEGLSAAKKRVMTPESEKYERIDMNVVE